MKQQIVFEMGGTLRFQPTLDGKPIAVGGGSTVTITRADGSAMAVAITDAEVTQEADGSLSYDVSEAAASISDPEANLIVDWTYTYNGKEVTRRDLFDCVRVPLYPVLSDDDVKIEMGKLKEILFQSAEVTYADTINLAFEEIYERIEAMGRRPFLVMESGQLKMAHAAKTLARIYSDQSGDPQDIWSARAKAQESRFQMLMDALPFRYDANDDGLVSQSEEGSQWGTSNIVRA